MTHSTGSTPRALSSSVPYVRHILRPPTAIFTCTCRVCTAHRRKPQLETRPSMCTPAASEPIRSSPGCTILLFHGTGAGNLGVTGILTAHACMQNHGSQFTDSGIQYLLVYRIHISGRIQGFEGFQHEMGDGGSCRKRCRPLQTELTGERGAYGPYAPRSPIFLVRTAHLRLREDPPSQSLGL